MSYIQMQSGGSANKKGSKYVHLAWNEWDSKRRRSVQHRLYVGRLGADEKVLLNKRLCGDREISVPLADLRDHAGDRAAFEVWLREQAARPAPVDGIARVESAGDAWLVRHLAEASGLASLLGEMFGPDDGGALAGLAAHQFVTGHALYRAECWLSQREVPASWRGAMVSEGAVHGFVARIGADLARRENFVESWVGRRKTTGAVLYDTTSVSSHSPSLDLAEWGYNRDDESLPQVNFSLAAAADGTPLFYRVIPGSIPDVRTVAATLRIARDYGLEQLCLSLDRGFYSRANLSELLALDCGLILGVPWSVTQAVALFKKHRVRLESPRHAFLYRNTPLRHVADTWKHDDASGLAAHLFYDPGRHADTALRVEKTVFGLAEKAARQKFPSWREARTWIGENGGYYSDCLRVVPADDGSARVEVKPNRVAAASARAGYTLVMTRGRTPDDEKPLSILRDYRGRDIAEKLFDVFKTEHGQYRLRTGVDESVQGRFFLGFLSLILRAELEKRMHAAALHKTYTDAGVLDELGKAKALITRKGTRILLEVSKRQRTLLAALQIPELA